MTAPRDLGASGSMWWENEGSRIARELRDVSALLVTGPDVDHAARVALGIAREESQHRHVALGDLSGEAAPLYAVAGGEDAFGLSDCLRQGLPLNDIARPAPDRDSLFILPAGSPPVACEEILTHERWPRLVNGFTKQGALLILVAPLDAPGIGALAGATGGVVLVDGPQAGARDFTVLATIVAPVRPPAVRAAAAKPARGRLVIAAVALLALLALLAAIVGAAWLWRARSQSETRATVVRPAAKAAAPPTAPAPPQDTVRLTDPVNPADTATAVPFAVEVMAANTLAGANSFLSDNDKMSAISGATVSPVVVGAAPSVWYRVAVGASHDRAGADSLLDALRRSRLLRSDEGRVVKVPYTLLLAERTSAAGVESLLDSWKKRGFDPYVLVQTDGSVRVFAGAFETPAQAATLASALRAAGVAPVLAFRTGRMH